MGGGEDAVGNDDGKICERVMVQYFRSAHGIGQLTPLIVCSDTMKVLHRYEQLI